MKLTNREKVFLITGTTIILIALFFLGYQQLSSKLDNFRSGKSHVKEEKIMLYQLAQEYQELRRYRNINKVSGNLSSEVENYLNQYGLLQDASLAPSQENIQGGYQKQIISISFSKVNILSLLQFVKEMENRPGYRIELFQSRILSEKKPGLYSVKIKIATFTESP